MIDYLTEKPLPLPKLVSKPSDPAEGEGTLSSNLKAGMLLLENHAGQAYRLAWEADESEAQRLRALPAGEYRLRTYRVLRKAGGRLWHTSATAPKIQTVTVVAGETLALELDSSITITSKLARGQAQMGIKGQAGAGLSIYCDSVRIPIGYRLTNASGKPLASGAMNYG